MAGSTSIQFTEKMRGFVSLNETNFEKGYEQGKAEGTALMFQLTIRSDDVDRFVEDRDHLADATGYVECEALGGRLPVERGWFNLFVETSNRDQRRMLYRLYLRKSDGAIITLNGFKEVEDNSGLDVWKDTTTLYVHLFNGHVTANEEVSSAIVAAGIIHIQLPDFMQQLTTIRTEGPTAVERIAAVEKFGRLFLGSLWDVYGSSCLPKEESLER